jgi:hypothetical protein
MNQGQAIALAHDTVCQGIPSPFEVFADERAIAWSAASRNGTEMNISAINCTVQMPYTLYILYWTHVTVNAEWVDLFVCLHSMDKKCSIKSAEHKKLERKHARNLYALI